MNNKTLKINILGTEYDFILDTLADNKRYEECAGYCDVLKKEIHVRHYTKDDSDNDEFTSSSYSAYEDKNIRHEIIHAFMYESGLWTNSNNIERWAMNEEMVDWLAIQMPKIMEAYKCVVNVKEMEYSMVDGTSGKIEIIQESEIRK